MQVFLKQILAQSYTCMLRCMLNIDYWKPYFKVSNWNNLVSGIDLNWRQFTRLNQHTLCTYENHLFIKMHLTIILSSVAIIVQEIQFHVYTIWLILRQKLHASVFNLIHIVEMCHHLKKLAIWWCKAWTLGVISNLSCFSGACSHWQCMLGEGCFYSIGVLVFNWPIPSSRLPKYHMLTAVIEHRD